MSWNKGKQLFHWEIYPKNISLSHASVPFALHLEGDNFMIYFGARNEKGHSVPFCIKAQIGNGQILLRGEPIGPLMNVGDMGTFDDSGVMPTCVVKHDGAYWMYYIGWNPQVTVSYRLSIGLAISQDGIHFERYSSAPLMDRSLEEVYFNTAPYVLKGEEGWEMYYVSCTGWKVLEGKTEPQYTVKRAFSNDGIHWNRENKIILDYDDMGEAFGRPCLVNFGAAEKLLFFSYRKLSGYRNVIGNAYQTAYAQWDDKRKIWQKKYEDTLPLGQPGVWDEQMACYGHVFEHSGIYWMLYNGNDFGKSGFGYAQWIAE
jgi:hypothetical protein